MSASCGAGPLDLPTLPPKIRLRRVSPWVLANLHVIFRTGPLFANAFRKGGLKATLQSYIYIRALKRWS